jgi:glycosyltransferase involved in cell wall biosynthesis
LIARDLLTPAATAEIHALFVHTLTVSLLASGAYERIPTIFSTDATPIILDSIAAAYGHKRQPEPVERIKLWLTRRVLQKARAYVSWSEWGKDSLVRDYGVDGSKVEVITPGTDLELFGWQKPAASSGKVRILFVGGDFERKGGDLLLHVLRERLNGKAELHLVTGADVPCQDDVFVYRGLTANSPPLLELFRTADIFALPTRADCLAMVLGEAMASSLPIVTTSVGAHVEAVQDGKTGFVVAPGDALALGDALVNLVENPSMRRQMGEAGRQLAEERFNARANAKRILELMESCRN